jgi:hypothetical protein
MSPEKTKELAELYKTWSTEQLVTEARIESESYDSEAVALMEAELRRREAPQQQIQQIESKLVAEVSAEVKKKTKIAVWIYYIGGTLLAGMYSAVGIYNIDEIYAEGYRFMDRLLMIVFIGYGFSGFYFLVRAIRSVNALTSFIGTSAKHGIECLI